MSYTDTSLRVESVADARDGVLVGGVASVGHSGRLVGSVGAGENGKKWWLMDRTMRSHAGRL